MPELITGTKGTPHVTSTQDRSIYEKIIGKGSYILDDNELLEPELQSNQSLRIRSGMLYHHGSITEVKRNTYDEVTIANGSQGMKRIDLVVARYTKNPETEIEEMNWVVIQGTPAANDPVAPSYTEGNMQEGDLTDDCPVFEVHLDGIQVTEVVKLLKVLDGSLEALNSKILKIENLDKVFWGGFLSIQKYNFFEGKSISEANLVYIRAGLQDFDLYTDWSSFPAAVGLDTDVSLSYYFNGSAYYSIKVSVSENSVTVKDISRGVNWQSAQMYLEIYIL